MRHSPFTIHDSPLFSFRHLLRFRSRMSFEQTRRRKFAKFMSDHIFGNEDRYMAFAVVHAKGQADHIWRDRRTPRPCPDRLRLRAAFGNSTQGLLQAEVDERSFF